MSENFLEKITSKKFSRRTFLKWSGAVTAPVIIGSSLPSGALMDKAYAAGESDEKVTIMPTCSTFDCGGKCLIKAHVKDDVITRVTTRSNEELNEQFPIQKACVRGRSYRMFQYHPDRLKYPMKRVGKRGEGKFERISWEEAVETIASETKRITKKYGPESRFNGQSTAVTGGVFDGKQMIDRLFALTGGYVGCYHSVSFGNTAAATPYTYGTSLSGSSLDTLLDTKLLILWGHNPAETIFGHSNYYFQELKKKGVKIIVVDPRYSETVAAYADEWIPLLPTTDNALMDAMLYVIINENLHDQAFIDRYCLGFDETNMPEGVPANESLVAYLFGQKDGIPKTPEWAEKICKVPADKIRQFAIEYGSTKPAALMQGWGPQRHYRGEQMARGSSILASVTGNVGISGGWASGFGSIERSIPATPTAIENPFPGSISVMNWVQAIEDASTLTADDGLKGVEQLEQNIKLIYNTAGNLLLSQFPDVNRTIKALEDESKVELIVVTDNFISPSSKFADIVLPETTFFERENLGWAWETGDYFIMSNKVLNQQFYEARTDYDWIAEVADKLGVGKEFTEGRSYADWIKFLYDETRVDQPDLPGYEKFKKTAVHYFKDGTRIAFKEQIDDPVNHPFETPSGKIEIFSKDLYDMNHDEIPAIPKYQPSWEGPEDTIAEKFPLQLITWKGKNRANSTFYSHPWLKEIQKQALWINPIDADKRGLKAGDKVEVFNDRGKVNILVNITQRIIPGAVGLQAGAWYLPDKNGIDQGGCANVLNAQKVTPLAKGNAHQTMLVEVKKL